LTSSKFYDLIFILYVYFLICSRDEREERGEKSGSRQWQSAGDGRRLLAEALRRKGKGEVRECASGEKSGSRQWQSAGDGRRETASHGGTESTEERGKIEERRVNPLYEE